MQLVCQNRELPRHR